MPWLQLRVNDLLLRLPKFLFVPEESDGRLHLNLEALKFFDPSHLLSLRPQPMDPVDCI
jgi:hypothetical protein